ncbi:queuosine precursor transporter [Tahibacter amnicola]|uniref:Probable queuosine precursor transporter n=1 Tax=Tahibacter amnicola TaxID=2976241 RepID=A0ABY6BBI4_9GAMM|nr:queuosine precursor transporter [Tahibacter amnicola]UXI66901.1 queuosine precursor transporter [Tahibacter amnicola]
MEFTNRAQKLFLILSCFFVANAVLAELIGVKIFALEDTLGVSPFNWNLFGQQGSLNFTAGTLLWPVVFIMTDVINEYFGRRGVRMISWVAVFLILYAFLFAFLAIALAPASWWVTVGADKGVPDMQAAFAQIFGQGLWTIGGSVTAFLVGQLIDVTIFHAIRNRTGGKHIWLRATGSTLVSQFFDSFIVLYIAFVIGPQKWPIGLWLAVGCVNYAYKVLAAVALTPVIYGMRRGLDNWLGKDLSTELKAKAAQ